MKTTQFQAPFSIAESHAIYYSITDGYLGTRSFPRSELGTFETLGWALKKAGQLADASGDPEMYYDVIDANGKKCWLPAPAVETIAAGWQPTATEFSDEIPF